MKNQQQRSEFEPWYTGDHLLTDSVILTETYVDSIISGVPKKSKRSPGAPKGILNSLILSKREDLLFWILIALALLVF